MHFQITLIHILVRVINICVHAVVPNLISYEMAYRYRVFCFWLINAILWWLTRNAGIVQFCQKIQFQTEGDFKWFRTWSLGISGTFRP